MVIQMTLLLSTTGAFFLDNWGELLIALLAFSKVVVNLTPTETDNRVFGYLDTLINAIVTDRIKDLSLIHI